ncbi:PAP2 superfamily-domain-containing protein [Delphinella strobiligena]|nr:PAP2 superfamily-domain-containing protein [Delphinella strobiligena]
MASFATSAPQAGTPNLGKPQFASHSWIEPVIVVSIMLGSLIFNRRTNYSILGRRSTSSSDKYLLDDRTPDLSDDEDDNTPTLGNGPKYPPKRRNCCFCTVIQTPNSSRFAHNYHSRILQKFPFLIEMFYWALNYVAYSMTKKIAASHLFAQDTSVTELAQDHGIDVLNFEHKGMFRFFFPIHEADVQSWLINDHQYLLTFVNRMYSLVHIPGTVAYLSWYYYAAPDHPTFAIARRTMTLGNFAAFFVFAFYPCMPPRLLPASFGFHDTVRQGNAESVWVGGGNVNQLAAMPSLHFTYAFVIGSTFLYHAGIIPGSRKRMGRSTIRMVTFSLLGVLYPLLVLTVIVATANHYWLDAVVALFTVSIAFTINRVWMVFLPAEDWLCWVLRVEKPVPTTGLRLRRQQAAEESWDGEEERGRQRDASVIV